MSSRRALWCRSCRTRRARSWSRRGLRECRPARGCCCCRARAYTRATSGRRLVWRSRTRSSRRQSCNWSRGLESGLVRRESERAGWNVRFTTFGRCFGSGTPWGAQVRVLLCFAVRFGRSGRLWRWFCRTGVEGMPFVCARAGGDRGRQPGPLMMVMLMMMVSLVVSGFRDGAKGRDFRDGWGRRELRCCAVR